MKVVNASSRGWSGRSGELPGGRFTLIELLVVISIIAVLAAILLPVLGRARLSAQNVVCMNNLRQQTTATLMYVDDNGEYPPGTLISTTANISLPHFRYASDMNYLSRYLDNGRTYVSSAMPSAQQVSPTWFCPFYLNSPDAVLQQDSGGAMGKAYRFGYFYTSGLPTVASASNIIVKPQTVPTSRSSDRLVLIADVVGQDTLTFSPSVIWAFNHLSSTRRYVYTPNQFPGMNRAYTDGSVVWSNARESGLDLGIANRNSAANYRVNTAYYFYW